MKYDFVVPTIVGSSFIIEKANSNYAKDFTVTLSEGGCWECLNRKPRQNSCGYIPYKKTYAHRYFYEKFKEKIPDKMVVRHLCNNVKCCNPEHLEIGTQSDNIRDMLKSFRQSNGKNKLTKNEIVKISKDNRPVKEIAEEYGIHFSTVYRIKNNDTYNLIEKKNLSKRQYGRKLLPTDVLNIYNSEEPIDLLSEKYNVSKWTIFDIKNGHTWNKVTKHKKGE